MRPFHNQSQRPAQVLIMPPKSPHPKQSQAGVVLLESLIAILIFSLGILALVGMQAFAVTASSEAKYRSDAALLANELIGRMWSSDRTPDTLDAAFSSPNGTEYKRWAWVGSDDAGTTSAPAAGTVLDRLPGAKPEGNRPEVIVEPVTATTPPSSIITVTVKWKAPNAPIAEEAHSFTTVTQIGG